MNDNKMHQYKLTQVVFMHGEETKYDQKLTVTEINKDDTYLRYIEAIDEHELKVTIRIGEGYVKLQRRGVVNMNLHFELGEKTSTYYDSPAGKHHFEVLTHRLITTEKTIEIKYDLFEADNLLGKYKYTLERI